MLDNQPTDRSACRKTLALVLAGGNGTRLQGLTRTRSKPAVHFGTRHRIVDFPLSNCVNSGLEHVALLTQYQSESLIDHVKGIWQARDRDFATAVEVWPAQHRRWYMGTADAVYQNRDRIAALAPDYVLVVASDHVYAMDYAEMCAAHEANRADVTISCLDVPVAESHAFGIVEIDDDSRVSSFVEKADRETIAASRRQAGTVIASMGIYLLNTEYLLDCLEADAANPDSRHDFGYSLMPLIMADAEIYAYLFRNEEGGPAYWRDVGTVDSYWLAHRELYLSDAAPLDLESGVWPMRGTRGSSKSVRLSATARIISSKLGSGCVVSGVANGSVLSMGCRIGEGSVVNDSILLPDAVVGRNCLLDRVIVDSGCHVPDDTVVHADAVRSLDRFHVSPQGIVLLTEDALNSHESALASKKTGAQSHVFLNRGHASPLPGHDRRTA